MPDAQKVMWPADAIDHGHDLYKPLSRLLVQLHVEPEAGDLNESTDKKTPESVYIIEAGATEFSKTALKKIHWAAVVSFVAAAAPQIKALEPSVRVALIVGLAIFLSTLAVSLAIVVSSDVRARGHGAAAQYAARAQMTEAFLRGAQSVAQTPSVNQNGSTDLAKLALLMGATSADGIEVVLADGANLTANGVRLDARSKTVEVRCGNHNWRPLDEIERFGPDA